MWSKVDQRMLDYFKETRINLLHIPQMPGNEWTDKYWVALLFITLVIGGCEAFGVFDRGLRGTKELR